MQDVVIEMRKQILGSDTHTLRLRGWMLKADQPTLKENTGCFLGITPGFTCKCPGFKDTGV